MLLHDVSFDKFALHRDDALAIPRRDDESFERKLLKIQSTPI